MAEFHLKTLTKSTYTRNLTVLNLTPNVHSRAFIFNDHSFERGLSLSYGKFKSYLVYHINYDDTVKLYNLKNIKASKRFILC
jgi:hypothetical protein